MAGLLLGCQLALGLCLAYQERLIGFSRAQLCDSAGGGGHVWGCRDGLEGTDALQCWASSADWAPAGTVHGLRPLPGYTCSTCICALCGLGLLMTPQSCFQWRKRVRGFCGRETYSTMSRRMRNDHQRGKVLELQAPTWECCSSFNNWVGIFAASMSFVGSCDHQDSFSGLLHSSTQSHIASSACWHDELAASTPQQMQVRSVQSKLTGTCPTCCYCTGKGGFARQAPLILQADDRGSSLRCSQGL